MPNVVARNGLTLRDARGHTGKVGWYYTYDPSAAVDIANARSQCLAIAAAIEQLTNALAVTLTGLAGQGLAPNSYGANTDYANAETKARMTFLTQNTSAPSQFGIAHIDVPAPLVSIFLADKQTVDPTNSAVVTFVTAMTTPDATAGQAVTKSNLVYLTFLGGQLQRRKFQRKITIWDKSAKLDEPEEG